MEKIAESLIQENENISILRILENNNNLPITERIALYHSLKKESSNPNLIKNENQLNRYGYSLLWSEKVVDAIAIFNLVVEEFPDSANAYDSLGDGYLASGEKEKSKASFKKSLELNPHNLNAEDQIFLIENPGSSFDKPEDIFEKKFSVSEYRSDLDQLAKSLIDINPNALKFISEQNFMELVSKKKTLINENTSYAEFRWHCMEVIASINCSHTSSGGFYTENHILPISLRFPLEVRWTQEKLYVTKPLNNENKVDIKDEITHINGIPVGEIIDNCYKRINTQGYVETGKKLVFNRWAMGMIPYALGIPESYNIQIMGKGELTLLNNESINDGPIPDYSQGYCGNDLCLQVLEEKKAAIMTLSSFNYYHWNRYEVWEKFIDSSFAVLEEEKIENLIFDFRFNGGGAPEASIHLLKYLLEKPFTYYSRIEGKNKTPDDPKFAGESIEYPFENRYKGNLYFIIDGHGASTTGHFMSIVKYFELGTIVGEELGSNQLCTAGGSSCRLKNTRIDYYVADITCVSLATTLPEDRGIMPDHVVIQNIDDYLNNVDAVKNFTLGLIKD